MSTEKMIIEAYRHFLNTCPTYTESQPVFERYALDELGLTAQQAKAFIRPLMVEHETDIDSPEFARFYTWYYINVMNAGNDWDTRILLPEPTGFTSMQIQPPTVPSEAGSQSKRRAGREHSPIWALFLQRQDGKAVPVAECAAEDAAVRLEQFLRLLLANWQFSLDMDA